MRQLLDYYIQQFKVTLAVQLQYRTGLMIWMIEIVIQPVIYLVVWQSAAGGDSIAGFAARDFAAYYIVLMVVDHFTQTWIMWIFEWRVRSGEMNKLLIRPMHPIHADIAENISYKLLMLVILIPAVIGLTAIFDPIFNTPTWAALAFIPVLMAAAALTFVTGWAVALAAFWTVRITAINQVYILGLVFFSGYIAPLDTLPGVLRTIADMLPFKWIMGFPVELFVGRLSQGEALVGFATQLAWIAVMSGIMMIVWRQGVKRYSAVGG